MKVVLEIKLPVGIDELNCIADPISKLYVGKRLKMRQEGHLPQIFYEDKACLPATAGGE